MSRKLPPKIVDQIKAIGYVHRAPRGRERRWYAGITNDPQRRLSEHRVDPKGDWAFYECDSEESARIVEDVLHELGYGGGGGGGNNSTVYVYTYKITKRTCEDC